MSSYSTGQRVRITLARNRVGQTTCLKHRGGVETDGLIGQVVSLHPDRDHSVGVQMLEVWCQGTPWIDSYHPDELTPA